MASDDEGIDGNGDGGGGAAMSKAAARKVECRDDTHHAPHPSLTAAIALILTVNRISREPHLVLLTPKVRERLESKRREWAMENTTPLGKRPRYVTLIYTPSSPTLDAVGEAAAATPHRTAPPSAPSCPPSP